MSMMPSIPLTVFSQTRRNHYHYQHTTSSTTPHTTRYYYRCTPLPQQTLPILPPPPPSFSLTISTHTHTHNSHTCSQQRISKLQAKRNSFQNFTKINSFNSINIDKKTNSNQHNKQRNYYFAIVITHSHCASLASFCDDWWIPYPIFEALLLNSD
jgi:hypothetical protein